MGLHLWNI